MDMAVTIGLSANAGVSVTTPSMRCWIDLLHEGTVETFSGVTEELWERICSHPDFKDPDVIAVSHFHPDHYSETLVKAARERFPNAVYAAPDRMPPGHMLKIGKDTILFLRTVHEGRAYRETEHYGILLLSEEHRIFFTADAKVGEEALDVLEPYLPVDVVVAAFPWLTTQKGRTLLREAADPDLVILYHLPFAQDDRFGYRQAAERICALENDPASELRERVGLQAEALTEPLEVFRIEDGRIFRAE